MKTVGFQPFRTDALFQPRDIALGPQQFPFFIVDQRQRRALLIQVFRHLDGDSVVLPLRQGIKQVTFAAKQAEGGFIEAHAIPDQRHHPVRERQHQHDGGGCQQKANPQRKG